jgi:hypothetical protein
MTDPALLWIIGAAAVVASALLAGAFYFISKIKEQ